MNNDQKLTIDNWKSEFERLYTKYRLLRDKSSPEAKGLMDHIEAVRAIIKDIEDSRYAK